MRKKKVLALMMAAAIAATVGTPAITAEAAGLTQAADASTVAYGSLTDQDVALLQNLFDFEYYKTQNPDLVEVLGDDYATLFEHFCKCGIFEGRTCNPNFDPAAYASAYADLKEVFGTDIVKYYEHYLVIGLKENRTITTVAACAEAGITVEALVGDNVKISPAVYKLAQIMGTNDFGTVQAAMDRAAAQVSSSSSSSGSSDVIIETASGTYVIKEGAGDTEAYAKASGLTKVGEISDTTSSRWGSFSLYLVKGSVGYAAYKNYTDETPVYKTKDYAGVDTKGSASTVYNVGLEIKENEDNTLEVVVGVSNDEDEFGCVTTTTVTLPDNASMEANTTEDDTETAEAESN